MANIKNFGLVGIGSDVQFGKSGPRLINDAGIFKFRNAGNTASVDLIAKEVTAEALAGNVGKMVTVDESGKLVLGGLATALATDAEVEAIRAILAAATLAEKNRAEGIEGAMQTELDNTQAGAGLSTTGVYVAETTSNYLNAAASLKAADFILDAAIKSANTRIDSMGTGTIANLQSELDRTQAAVGVDATGNFIVLTGKNYINDATSAMTAVTLLDAAVKVRADAIAQEITDRAAADALKLDLAGGTMTGNIAMSGGKVTGLAAPTASGDAATKNYVDSMVSGLTWENPVSEVVAAIAGFDASAKADGYTVASIADGKLYTVTGGALDVGVAFLDGAAFFDKSTETGYVATGTSLVQFTGAGQVNAGVGLVKTGNTIDINMGAGITQLPSDEVGIDVRSDSGLFLTLDGTLASVDAGAKLAIKLDGTTLSMGVDGLRVSAATMTAISDNATAVGTEKTRAEAAELALQTELNNTQAGAGLSELGAYIAESTSNYINTATSFKSADFKLDAQIKSVADSVAAMGTGSISNLQTEVNNLELTLGALVDGNGVFVPVTGSNYFTGKTTVTAMFMALDVVAKSNADAIAQEVTDRGTAITNEVTARNNAITAAINLLTTTDIEEGTNLYFTVARAQAAISIVAPAANAAGLTYVGGVLGLNEYVASKADVATAKAEANTYTDSKVAAAVVQAQTNVARAVHTAFTGADTIIGLVKGFVHRVKVYVTTAAGTDSAIQIGTIATNNAVATTADVDSSVVGLYTVEVSNQFGADTELHIFAPGAAGHVVVEYLA